MDLYRKKTELSGCADCQINLSFEAIAKGLGLGLGLDVPVFG
jgi:hypothetical protein